MIEKVLLSQIKLSASSVMDIIPLSIPSSVSSSFSTWMFFVLLHVLLSSYWPRPSSRSNFSQGIITICQQTNLCGAKWSWRLPSLFHRIAKINLNCKWSAKVQKFLIKCIDFIIPVFLSTFLR
jgi:hypothetical protein